jgi:16S rRNA A1518/A1519 N6-dimethyltransferase RsmA/KsgA/DIM1 with predicted DNA glycosylase/AP lyase activity
MVVAVEKDERSVEYMKENFAEEVSSGTLRLIQDDILDINPLDIGLEKGNYVIAANIPYYITGEILRKFLTTQTYPARMVMLVQKEVAKRIVAADKKESILSISVKAYGEPKYIDTVPKRFFRPMPKVDSAIILIDKISKRFFENDREKSKGAMLVGKQEEKIEVNSEGLQSPPLREGIPCRRVSEEGAEKDYRSEKAAEQDLRFRGNDKQSDDNKVDEKMFFEVVRAGFAHKRKVVRGNLAKIIPAQALERLWKEKRWPDNDRAEDFTLEQWKELIYGLEN